MKTTRERFRLRYQAARTARRGAKSRPFQPYTVVLVKGLGEPGFKAVAEVKDVELCPDCRVPTHKGPMGYVECPRCGVLFQPEFIHRGLVTEVTLSGHMARAVAEALAPDEPPEIY